MYYPGQDFLGLKGFGDIINPTGAERFEFVIRVSAGADEDYRGICKGRVLFNFPAGLEAVDFLHVDIHQDQIR